MGVNRVGEVRLNPEVDDLLEWLQISTEGLDYELQNRVLESLLCHEEILRQRIVELRSIMSKAAKLQEQKLPWYRIRRHIQLRLGGRFRGRIAVPAQLLSKCFQDKTERRECLESICGIACSELEKYVAAKIELPVEVSGLLAARSGRELLATLGIENICVYGRYSLARLQAKIQGMFAGIH